MKRNNFILMAMSILFVGGFLLQGCRTDVERIGRPGADVVFKASTYYKNSPKTRTEYSNVVVNGIERINWVVGDKIRIYSDKATDRDDAQHFSDYKIKSVNENGSKSEATIDNVGTSDSEGNGLVWENGEHNFFSVYPSPLTNSSVASEITSTGSSYNVLSFNIPNVQTYSVDPADATKLHPDMDYAYMCAAVKANSGETVMLSFKPMYTAFQFTVDSEDDAQMVLYSFSLSSANSELAGIVKVTATPSTNSAESAFSYGLPDGIAAYRTVTVNFGTDGVTIEKGHPVTFTVFARPQEYNDLTIHFETSAGSKSLALNDGNGQGVKFYPEIKYNIGLGGMPGSEYVLNLNDAISGSEVTALAFDKQALTIGGYKDVIVSSYRENKQNTATKWPVSWKAMVSVDNGATWVEHDNAAWPDWLSLNAYEGDGGIDFDTFDTVRVSITPDPAQTTVVEKGSAHSMEALKAAAEVGSESAPVDLSLYDIYGNLYPGAVPSITKAGSHTANCYVLNRPGWFCLPLVYGNAIDQTRGNASGYNTKAYSKYFNADNNLISSPFILNDLGLNASECDAVVLWLDQVSSAAVIREDVEIITAPSGAGLSCDYLKFHIAQANILPGNAVIALRDKNKRIVWSWHIWITATPNSSNSDFFKLRDIKYRTERTENATLASAMILNCNLGWTAPMQFSVSTAGETLLKFVQVSQETNPLEKQATVSYVSGDIYSATYASGTFYQWGRKDPFLPSNGNTGSTCTNRACFSPIGFNILSEFDPVKGVSIEEMGNRVATRITKPTIFDNSQPNSTIMSDYWNASFGRGDDYGYDRDILNAVVIKTVYDPCPAGFSVPIGNLFTGFTKDGHAHDALADVNGTRSSQNSTTGNPSGMRFSYNASHVSSTYNLFFPAAGMRGHRGPGGQSSAGQIGIDHTNTSGYYFTCAVPSSTGSNYYFAYGMFIASTTTSNPNINPVNNEVANGALLIRPMLEQTESSINATGENLKVWD